MCFHNNSVFIVFFFITKVGNGIKAEVSYSVKLLCISVKFIKGRG